MKVKEDSEKPGLKLNIQKTKIKKRGRKKMIKKKENNKKPKTKIMASGPSLHGK